MLMQALKPSTALAIKKYGYFIFLVPLFMPVLSYYWGQNSEFNNLYAWSALAWCMSWYLF